MRTGVGAIGPIQEMERQMLGIYAGVTLAASGLLVSWAGQGIWRNSPDSLWAAIAVTSVLSAVAIVLKAPIARLLSPITGGAVFGRRGR